MDLSAGVEVDIKLIMSRRGLITTKLETPHFSDDGTSVHVTLLKVDPCIVSKVK